MSGSAATNIFNSSMSADLAASSDVSSEAEENYPMVDPTVDTTFTILRICLSVFGVLANMVTGVVLTNKRLWSPTSLLLLSLVAYDAIFLLVSIPMSVWGVLVVRDLRTFALVTGIFYPLRYMAQTGSIYTTVTVTVERFLIVLRPLKARVFCTFGNVRKVTLAIFLFSILFNIPRCFFYQLATSIPIMQNNSMMANQSDSTIYHSDPTAMTVSNNTQDMGGVNVTLTLRPLTEEEENRVYYLWLYQKVYELYVTCVFFYLLPYLLIPILNIQLLLAIKRRRDETRRISVKNEHQINSPKPTDLEDGLTLIVVGITVCFFICCLIPAIYNVIQIVENSPANLLSSYLLIANDTMLTASVISVPSDALIQSLHMLLHPSHEHVRQISGTGFNSGE
ncbi:FMRFamide receptor-like [Aplysia californica]|uniref:FMRFamide receptor-like n=1 Tax=Aplysia californica TaxID=6500 RepID=A0ABM1W3Z1_APLCA|nr:FMRFamide receptor-like [Aplysia californica]